MSKWQTMSSISTVLVFISLKEFHNLQIFLHPSVYHNYFHLFKQETTFSMGLSADNPRGMLGKHEKSV